MPFARRSTIAALAFAGLVGFSVHAAHAARDASPTPPAALTPGRPAALQGALGEPTILAILEAANTADVETSELAVKKGTSKDVKDLAAHFAGDHKAVRQQGRDLAKKLNVTPTPPKDD